MLDELIEHVRGDDGLVGVGLGEGDADGCAASDDFGFAYGVAGEVGRRVTESGEPFVVVAFAVREPCRAVSFWSKAWMPSRATPAGSMVEMEIWPLGPPVWKAA